MAASASGRAHRRSPARAPGHLVWACALFGCGSGTGPGEVDGGPDAGRRPADAADAAVALDADLDAASPGADAGVDAGPTTGPRETFTFDPATAHTFTTSDGASVTLTAGALATDTGDPPTGRVTVSVQSVLTARSGPEDMPGGFAGRRASGELVVLFSYGVIDVTFTDEAGADLDLSPGRTAVIGVPSFTDGPDVVPMWYLPEGGSVWEEEGTGVRVGDRYEATVSHFTPWNCDDGCDGSCIVGAAPAGSRVVARLVHSTCPGFVGSPLSGAVEIVGASGRFEIAPLVRGSFYHLTVTSPGGEMSEQVVQTPLDTADECQEATPVTDFALVAFDWTIGGMLATAERCEELTAAPQILITGAGFSIGGACHRVDGEGVPFPLPFTRPVFGAQSFRFQMTDVSTGREVVFLEGPVIDAVIERSRPVRVISADFPVP